jgi:EAL domain-containing protein (putative c-di-GMP-specific phosphodiesterase class I)
MATIAEGVETKEQLDRVRAEGCTEAQGYYFSRPRPASEIAALLSSMQQTSTCRLSAWCAGAVIVRK